MNSVFTFDLTLSNSCLYIKLYWFIYFPDMAPYYEGLCKDLKWQLDSDLLSKMKKANDEELKRLDDVLEDAEKSLGESEIRDAMMARAEYLIRIGDKVSPRQCAHIKDMYICQCILK